jgi:AcrR family transcriptional regulator
MEALEKNKKFTALMDSARRLFWKHGFRRVSIEEICHDARISKMTFYRFFHNKTELAKSVLDRFYEDNLTVYRKIMSESTSVADKLRKLIQMKFEGTNDLSFEFMQDFMFSKDLGLAEYYEKKIHEIISESIVDFKRGQTEGWIRKDLNVEFMFFFSQKIMVFLNDRELLSLFNSPQDLVNELTKLIVYGIAPRE